MSFASSFNVSMSTSIFISLVRFVLTGLIIGFGINYLIESFDSNPNQLNIWSIIYLCCVLIMTIADCILTCYDDERKIYCDMEENFEHTSWIDVFNYLINIAMFAWGVSIFVNYESVNTQMWIWFQVALWSSILYITAAFINFMYFMALFIMELCEYF